MTDQTPAPAPTEATLTAAEWEQIACQCHETLCPIHNEHADSTIKMDAVELYTRIHLVLAARGGDDGLAFKAGYREALTDAFHPEFGTAWREPDGECWKAYAAGLAEGRAERDHKAEPMPTEPIQEV